MALGQFVRQRLTILKTQIQLAHVKHIRAAETFAIQGAQVFGQAIQQAAAVFSSRLPHFFSELKYFSQGGVIFSVCSA
jgi:hypothetical protein